MHSRLLAVRSLLRLAFNGVNVLEGRPPEEYAVQNPPHHAQSGGTQKRQATPSTSTAAPSASTASTSATAAEAQATAPHEGQQVKTEAAVGDIESSAEGQSEVGFLFFYFKVNNS